MEIKNLKYYTLLIGLILSTQFIFSRPLSIADKAKITASSELNKSLARENINDGLISVQGKGSWMAKGKEAWIQLNWKELQLVDKEDNYNYT